MRSRAGLKAVSISLGVLGAAALVQAGILVQTVIFGSTQTGVALAEDMSRGMVDRFRSLPMARSAVLAGRTGRLRRRPAIQ